MNKYVLTWLVGALLVSESMAQVGMPVPASSGSAAAGGVPIEIRKIKGGTAQTPEYKLASNVGAIRPRQWYIINTEYRTEPDWVNQLDFRYYVLVKPKRGESQAPVLFVGDVSYVNIERGDHLSAVFLHPSTLARFGTPEAVAVEVRADGRLVAIESLPKTSQRWWEQLQPVRGSVLNHLETPFAMVNYDMYEAIKTASEGR